MGKITYKALGVLLIYPSAELIGSLDEIYNTLEEDAVLSKGRLKEIKIFMSYLKDTDLMDLEHQYVATFDQTPSLSLNLFEHIHGESNDRGPAMVDLSNMYEAIGLKLSPKELPDYLPAFTEYLSLLPEKDAKVLLGHSIHVVKKIEKHLRTIKNQYHVIFGSLIELAT